MVWWFDSSRNPEPEPMPPKPMKPTREEWVWVDGFKGTYSDMCGANNFQFTLGARYDINGEIKLCERGFHLCLKPEDVFSYYDIGGGNRYFRVRALVRQDDVSQYGLPTTCFAFPHVTSGDKIVAKSIIFLSEIGTKELYNIYYSNSGISDEDRFSLEEFALARNNSIEFVFKKRNVDKLVSLGYSFPFAEYICNSSNLLCENKVLEAAKVIASQDGLSMDMKVAFIMRHM